MNKDEIIKTQQAEIKEYKKIIAQDNKEYEHMKKSLKGIISRSNAEIEKKDKIIDEMAEQLTTPLHSEEWVKEYYKNKVETEDK